MLVLSRWPGEQVVISRDGVEIGRVMVVNADRGKVQVGFDFPHEVTVDRLEVWEAKQLTAKERGDAERETKQVKFNPGQVCAGCLREPDDCVCEPAPAPPRPGA